MFALKDILELLDRWPTWKKIQEAPEQIGILQKRVTELENKLARAPGEACPSCGELEYRAASSTPHKRLGNMGVIERQMKCSKCGYSEKKTITPSKQ
jgi:C4-type Zn-finger protein